MFDFTAERVTASIDESLKRLGVEYIDSIQVHDPEFAPSLDIICNETLPALAKARDAGKVRAYSGSIGGMTGRFWWLPVSSAWSLSARECSRAPLTACVFRSPSGSPGSR